MGPEPSPDGPELLYPVARLRHYAERAVSRYEPAEHRPALRKKLDPGPGTGAACREREVTQSQAVVWTTGPCGLINAIPSACDVTYDHGVRRPCPPGAACCRQRDEDRRNLHRLLGDEIAILELELSTGQVPEEAPEGERRPKCVPRRSR
jgi:hypothetical protein